MPSTDTVVIGAGHAGLAMSRCLADRDVRHVVLDRGCVGERWRTARWDSFRLLTPNWLSRLPGWRYIGPDPDGFMSSGEFVGYLSDYARSFDAPVHAHTGVRRVERAGDSFSVHTDDAYAAATPGAAAGLPDPPPVIAVSAGPSRIDLRQAGISAVVWATGYRPWYPWLKVPVLDAAGRIRHHRGVTAVPGLYAIGLRFQHRRSSTFVDGARHDAAYLSDKITAERAVRVGVCGGLL